MAIEAATQDAAVQLPKSQGVSGVCRNCTHSIGREGYAVHGTTVPGKAASLAPRSEIPPPHRLIAAARKHRAAVSRIRQAHDGTRVPFEPTHEPVGGG